MSRPHGHRRHGSRFGEAGQRGPTDEELEAARTSCEVDARLMRHCRQCRADAVGGLGEDRFREFTLARLPSHASPDGGELRAARREAIDRARALAARARDAAVGRLAGAPAGLVARVAVATRSGGRVDEHFGHARELLVYDVTRAGARLVGRRPIARYCGGGEGDTGALSAALRVIRDCRAILVARIGRCPQAQLAAAGLEVVIEQAFRPIEAAALAWFEGFVARVARGEATGAPPSRATGAATRAGAEAI